MEKCFIIQSYDNDLYKKRYNDIFKPAIIKAGLEPYWIEDNNPTSISFEDIENEILNSRICFVDLTIDSPSLWIEYGFALACKKDIVVLCADERNNKFPFDIQHEAIIKYKISSTNDNAVLEETIKNRLEDILHSCKNTKESNTIRVKEIEEFKGNEMAILSIIMEDLFYANDSLSYYSIKSQMNKAGYSGAAFNVGILELNKKGIIKTVYNKDYNDNNIIIACKLTKMGKNWVIKNQNKFEFIKKEEIKEVQNNYLYNDDDNPF